MRIRCIYLLLSLVCWCAITLTWSTPAAAHAVGKGLANISIAGNEIHYNLSLAISAAPPQGATEHQLGPEGAAANYAPLLAAVRDKIRVSAGGKACEPKPGSIAPPATDNGSVAIHLEFVCDHVPQSLLIHDDLFDVLSSGYHTIASIQWSGGSQQFVFLPQQREVTVALHAAPEQTRGAGSFFPLGIEHILTGYDHLLFLLALILRGGNLLSLLKIITAFTVAHSITLALAALNIVTLPETLVEATIALSIAYVAAENIFLRRAVSHRWAVSFLFGLVHGFGFSNVLRELGLPQQGLLWSLLNFNLGVETGQAAAVLIAVPILIWLRRFKWEPRAIVATSSLVLVVGLVLFVERLFFA